jgi:hypothetical protein
MITQGFANELYHISNFFNCEVKCDLEYLSKKITCSVFGRYISVNYNGELIWRECLDENIGNFGIESVQHIFYIIDKIEKNDPDWRNLIYIEKSEDLNEFYKQEYDKFKKELINITSDKNTNDQS